MRTDKPRILITATTYPRWENDHVPRFVADLAERLTGNYAVDVLAPHYKGAKRKEVENEVLIMRFRYAIPASAQDVVYKQHAVRGIKKSPVYAIKLIGFLLFQTLALLRPKKYSIINAHWLIPQGVLAVATRRIHRAKVVITIHGSDIFSLNGRLLRAVKRYALKRADAVIVNSSSTQQACKELYADRTYPIIPPGVDEEYFYPPKTLKTKLPISVLFVGRLAPEKGVQYILEALSDMDASLVKQINLNIVGEGSERARLEAYTNKHKLVNVTFTGWLQKNELSEFYRNADVLLAPTIGDESGIREAFGLVIVEAMSSGLSVIATDTGALRDTIEPGVDGVVINQGSSDDIKDILATYVSEPDLLTERRKNSLKHAASKYSWKHSIADYEEVFSSL